MDGNNKEAIEVAEEALIVAERTYGPNHNKVFDNLKCLSALYKLEGRYSEAAKLCQRAMEIYKTIDHPFAPYHTFLGLYDKNKFIETESIWYQALAEDEKEFGKDHLCVGLDLNILVKYYIRQEKYDKAEPLRKRALAILEKELGFDDPNTFSYFFSLVVFYFHHDRYVEAETHCRRLLSLTEEVLGEDHHEIITTKCLLGQILYRQEKYAEAVPVFEQCLEKSKDQEQAYCMHYLADTYKNLGKYIDAEVMYQQLLDMAKEQYGPDHRVVNKYILELFRIYRKMNRPKDAAELREILIEKGILITGKR
jgi:tetratricopeptide (TPR) repeat protein